ncbi:Hypothetical predicted protein [Mytilus galloprovincialis]|uniref:Mab-21-like HhH/H2TH-like domain-containing protein n=1 Tax=Mytilus galloprovincialis TaxID=29158 RepID=A0A8B6CA34_MYTGA|nr:Hypothetical predicted protein [Mytilus galloprovincialis]
MCHHIVGYEDHVKTIRMMNNVRDNLMSDEEFTFIASGNFGEGLELKGSDIDIMAVLKNVDVHEHVASEVLRESKTCFSMNREDTKPGFTFLCLENTYANDNSQLCLDTGGKLFLSNELFKQCFARTLLPVNHGPSLSDKHGLIDLAFCLHSKSWVIPANQWSTRQNNSWPSVEIKQNIIDHGVIFVPIGVRGSINEELEWRLSFSVGEKLLIYTFSHTQMLCYALFKILLKDIISSEMQCKDLLCSYFLKTIMFWVSEEIQPLVWTPENLIPCFMRCFRRLIYCVNYSVCPHYFIPENNLFENKIEGLKRHILLINLNTLHVYGWRCIFFSPQLSVFEISKNPNISFIAYTYNIKNIAYSKGLSVMEPLFRSCQKEMRIRRYTRAVYTLLCFQSTKIRRIHLYNMSLICRSIPDALLLISRRGNKNKYEQYKNCLSHLLRNIHHDSVSGWLLLASFLYRTQQFDKALELISYALAKCSLEKMYRGRNLSHINIELLSRASIRKKGITYALKMLNVQMCYFSLESFLIPTELQIEGCSNPHKIPPVVYAHLLRFLCYYHLGKNRQCRESITDLQVTITHGYFIEEKNRVHKAISYNCLGVALQLLGEIENATYAFRQSIELFPDTDSNAAFTNLSQISLI